MQTMEGIRLASKEDAEALLAIYRPYVEKTAISFETVVPSLAEFQRHLEMILERYPYFVVDVAGELLGYAYLQPFIARAAYDWVAEWTIYLREDQKGKGWGRRLYQAIEKAAKAQHLTTIYGCVGVPAQEENAYLNFNSAHFHQHLGFREVGHFHQCGYKFGQWLDMVWLEKRLGDVPLTPEPFVPYGAL